MKAQIKRLNKVLFVTPNTAQIIFEKGLLSSKNSKCFSLVIDKLNMHQAFDLDSDLIELTKLKGFPTQGNVHFRTIITTNTMADKAAPEDEA